MTPGPLRDATIASGLFSGVLAVLILVVVYFLTRRSRP